MLREVLTVSALIAVVLLVRAIFKNRVPKRMLYALWLVVLLKLCLPGTLVSLPVLPAEDAAVPAQSAERPVQTAPVIQRPAQTVTKPQTPAQQPVSPVQETAKPAAKPLTTAQILQIAWFSGSALLGLWLFGAWAVFTIRLHRDRRFLGKRGGTCIYVSGAVKSPCLAGLIPAVYLTEDVLQADEAELILRHELTHLRHLDFLWSFCRAAAVSVYWWNPFVWLAALISGRDAELACDEAVAAGRAADKAAVHVFQRHGQPVDLRLDGVFRVRLLLAHMRVEFTQFVEGKYILQALQRNGVTHLDEFAQRLPADTVRRTERRGVLRILRFQFFQPAQLVVVIIIAHLGIIEHIIEIPRVFQFPGELFNLLFRFHIIPSLLLW